MTDFEDKIHSPVLEFQWEPKGIEASPGTILSEMINFQGQKIFQVGLRNGPGSSILLFVTFGLKKMGLHEYLKVVVTGPGNIRQNLRFEKEDDNPPSVQLYSTKFNDMMSGDLSFIFHVYLNTCAEVPNYYPLRVDTLLGLQLWSAAVTDKGQIWN